MKHVLAVIVALSSSALAAPSVATAPVAAPAPHSVYRFDVTITGVDPTPATYTLDLEEGEHGGMSTGTNIPLTLIANGASARENVGLSLHMSYTLRGATVLLAGDVEMSSADPATANGAATIHRVRAESVVPIAPGTPSLFSSAYDITSKRRYEVNVTAQRLL